MPRAQTVKANGISQRVLMAGEGPALVLIHGLGWQAELWERQIARLSARYRVVAPDLRGHGETPRGAEPPSTKMFADDIDGLLEALGIARAAFVGFSLGGPVVMDLALRKPSKVAAAVFACCASGADPADEPATLAFIEHARALGPVAFAKEQAGVVFSMRWAAENPDAVQTFIERRSAMDFNALLDTFRSGFGVDYQEKLGEIGVPALVLAADDDPFVSAAVVAAIAERLPQAQFHTIAPSGHHVSLEQPDAFEALLSGFLDAHYPAKVRA